MFFVKNNLLMLFSSFLQDIQLLYLLNFSINNITIMTCNGGKTYCTRFSPYSSSYTMLGWLSEKQKPAYWLMLEVARRQLHHKKFNAQSHMLSRRTLAAILSNQNWHYQPVLFIASLICLYTFKRTTQWTRILPFLSWL